MNPADQMCKLLTIARIVVHNQYSQFIVVLLLAWFELKNLLSTDSPAFQDDGEHNAVLGSMGMLSALSGILFASRLQSAITTAGTLFELNSIAAAYIGGVSAAGRVGDVVGSLIGALVYISLTSRMNLMGLDISSQYIVRGVVLRSRLSLVLQLAPCKINFRYPTLAPASNPINNLTLLQIFAKMLSITGTITCDKGLLVQR